MEKREINKIELWETDRGPLLVLNVVGNGKPQRIGIKIGSEVLTINEGITSREVQLVE